MSEGVGEGGGEKQKRWVFPEAGFALQLNK